MKWNGWWVAEFHRIEDAIDFKKHCIWSTTKKEIAANNNTVVYLLVFSH